MPKSSLPFSVPIKPFAPPEACEAAQALDATDAPSPTEVRESPGLARVPTPLRKEVSAMFFRLLASFARSDAVHQARLDQCWNGPHRYLMAHNTWSAK